MSVMSIQRFAAAVSVAVIAFGFAALTPTAAFAVTSSIAPAPAAFSAQAEPVAIAPSGDKTGKTDGKAIYEALQAGNSIVLQNGATYYTHRNLIVGSNTTIEATGATIIGTESESGGFRNAVQDNRFNYDSCVNVTVNGGYWKHVNVNGFQHSMIQFTHASNITLQNLTVEGSFEHHSMEFIACKNVKVDNCNIISIGKCRATAAEDAIQLDIASPRTAPTIKSKYGSASVAGQTCQDVVVNNCTVLGSRGIATNYTKDTAYMGKCHKNITITNCKVTAKTSEAVSLFNVSGNVKVKGNTLVSKSKRTSTAYSIGLHCALFGKVDKKTAKTTKFTIEKNTIKGGRQGLFACSHATNGAKMGKFTIKSNKVYCKQNKANAIRAAVGNVTKWSTSKNKTYKWK